MEKGEMGEKYKLQIPSLHFSNDQPMAYNTKKFSFDNFPLSCFHFKFQFRAGRIVFKLFDSV